MDVLCCANYIHKFSVRDNIERRKIISLCVYLIIRRQREQREKKRESLNENILELRGRRELNKLY